MQLLKIKTKKNTDNNDATYEYSKISEFLYAAWTYALNINFVFKPKNKTKNPKRYQNWIWMKKLQWHGDNYKLRFHKLKEDIQCFVHPVLRTILLFERNQFKSNHNGLQGGLKVNRKKLNKMKKIKQIKKNNRRKRYKSLKQKMW